MGESDYKKVLKCNLKYRHIYTQFVDIRIVMFILQVG